MRKGVVVFRDGHEEDILSYEMFQNNNGNLFQFVTETGTYCYTRNFMKCAGSGYVKFIDVFWKLMGYRMNGPSMDEFFNFNPETNWAEISEIIHVIVTDPEKCWPLLKRENRAEPNFNGIRERFLRIL